MPSGFEIWNMEGKSKTLSQKAFNSLSSLQLLPVFGPRSFFPKVFFSIHHFYLSAMKCRVRHWDLLLPFYQMHDLYIILMNPQLSMSNSILDQTQSKTTLPKTNPKSNPHHFSCLRLRKTSPTPQQRTLETVGIFQRSLLTGAHGHGNTMA